MKEGISLTVNRQIEGEIGYEKTSRISGRKLREIYSSGSQTLWTQDLFSFFKIESTEEFLWFIDTDIYHIRS